MNELEKPKLFIIKGAAELLGISLPTFRRMRKTPKIMNLEIPMGNRIKFREKDILDYMTANKDETVPWTFPKGHLSIVSAEGSFLFEVEPNVFDLKMVRIIDAFGTLSLLTNLIGRSRANKSVKLLVDSSLACNKLQYVGFFNYLKQFAPQVEWDENALDNSNFIAPDSLIPITLIQRKGEERTVINELNSLFIKQGFSSNIGPYVGQLIGELADNSLTHGTSSSSGMLCFIQAERYTVGKNTKCVILGIADLGVGIQGTLKTNPKYKDMSDSLAILYAFLNKVSSWDDDAKRGKGLTDIIKIAMGNKSMLRVSSGDIDFKIDFQVKDKI